MKRAAKGMQRLMEAGERFRPREFGTAGVDTWQKLTTAANRTGVVRDVSCDHRGGRVTGV